MARLAWFTPLPPVRSGIAAYSAELLPLLSTRHEIDVFTDPPPPLRGSGEASPPFAPLRGSGEASPVVPPLRGSGEAGSPPALDRPAVFPAHEFVWRHGRAPYDLIVYQMGNAACHDFMWPHLARYPGLVVLHDGQLHHERSRALLSRGRTEEYRAEFRYNHPDAPSGLPDLVISTLAGSLYYLYPMLRWVVRTARLVAVHSPGLAAEIRAAHPGVEVNRIRHGMVDPVTAETLAAGALVRERHAIPAGSLVFAAFGLVTPEKRVSAGLRGLARLAAERPNVYLLVAGGTTSYYDATAEARALGIADRVRIAGYVPDEELPAYVLASDACLCLRWPTSRETSGTWIRAIAAGRPTLISDLAHTCEVPALDPRTWQPLPSQVGAGLRPRDEGPSLPPVSVAIDLLDEDESLYLAMKHLAGEPDLRRDLGRAAREYWNTHHTMDHSVADYLQAIERALHRPIPRVRDLPAHLLDDGTDLARGLVSAFGVEVDVLDTFRRRGSMRHSP